MPILLYPLYLLPHHLYIYSQVPGIISSLFFLLWPSISCVAWCCTAVLCVSHFLSLAVTLTVTLTTYDCYLSILCVNVCLCLHGCTHTDWSQRCVKRVSDGIWEMIIELVTCSPWITYIFIITLFHTVWASVSLTQQLYQVCKDTFKASLFFSSCWQ